MNSAQRTALKGIISDELGVPVVQTHRPQTSGPTAARPPRPYVSIDFSARATVGRPVSQMRKLGDARGDEIADVYQVSEQTVVITVWDVSDDAAADKLEALQMLSAKLTPRLALSAANLAILRELSATDGAELRSAHWEGRAEWEIRVGFTASDEEDRGIIEGTTLEIETKDPDHTVTVEVTS